MARFLLVTLIITSQVLFLNLDTCHAQRNKKRKTASAGTPVQLRADKRGPLVGRKPRALKWNEETGHYDAVPNKSKFQKDGTCVLNVPPGKYYFEIFDATKYPIVCVRSEQISIGSKPTVVKLPAIDMQLELYYQGKPIELSRFAARALTFDGDVKKTYPQARLRTDVHCTPEMELDITLTGFEDDIACLGFAKITTAEKVQIKVDGPDWRSCTIETHPDNPPLTVAKLAIRHARSDILFDIKNKITLITNRPALELWYRLKENGPGAIVSRRTLVNLDQTKSLKFGGELTPSAYAEIMEVKRANQKHLICDGVLNDAEGREINVNESKLDWDTEILVAGKKAPDNPLDESGLAAISNPQESTKVKLSWNWKGKHNAELTPEKMINFRSRRFALKAPKGWSDRAGIYLSALEHTASILRKKTGRKGPKLTKIRWRLNKNNASSRIGGKKESWMSMPFVGLQRANNEYSTPKLMVKMMLQTMGMRQGKDLQNAARQGDQGMKLARWEMEYSSYMDPEILEKMTADDKTAEPSTGESSN